MIEPGAIVQLVNGTTDGTVEHVDHVERTARVAWEGNGRAVYPLAVLCVVEPADTYYRRD